MQRDRFEQARDYALDRLKRDLPPGLFYHGLDHTLADVLPAVEALAAAEGVQGPALWLLRTAAVFHDLGFVECRQGHEAASARLAGEVLPALGHDAAEVAAIQELILATALPQTPRSLAGQILADADLDVLGRPDFWTRSADLRRELAHFGQVQSDRDWLRGQVRFLQDHRYFTASARTLRDPGKSRNLADLQSLLRAAGEGL